jgi:hypothetical protein
MPSKVVVFVVVLLLAVALIFSSTSQILAKPRQAGPVTCRYGGPGKVMCCQDRPGAYASTVTWCTVCDNTSPPSNCSDRYCVSGCMFARLTGNITGTLLPPTNALPPSGNSTGTPPPGSIIKVPPGTIGSATNPPPTNNNTGNPIAMKSSDNPPGCSKQIPIPLNCTLNPFNNSVLNKAGTVGSAINPSNTTGTASLGNIIKVPLNHTNALPTGNNTGTPPPALKLSQPSLAGQQPQTQQTTGHHHKGSNTGASTSSGNSTKK